MKKENLIQNLLDFKNYIKKYNENVKEVLEFAELYEKFIVKKNSKWR